MSAITAKASRKMKKYAVLTREPRCFLGSFDFSWEQRKLSEMCGTFEYGLNAAAKEFDGKNKYIRITDIDDASREFLLSDLSSPDICLDGMSKYLLSSGDIVFARTGASVGKTYIYRENDGIVYFAGFLIRAKVNQDNDAEFVFQSTLSPSYEKYIRITSQRSGQPGVNAQEYGEYDLFAPSKEEQQRIGQFLRGIDHLITLHQRKYAFLFRRFRAAISKKLATSTFSWEQRKLGDVVQEITRNDPESEAPIMMITANNGFIEQSERYAFNNAGESLKKYILLKKGELAYNHGASKLRPYGSCFALTTAENARIPFVYHCFSAENQNAEFMSIELNGAEIENQLRKIVSSGARMDGLLNISFDEYTSVSVLLPNTEEQDRIADFFRQLDHLITLHQRERISFSGRASRLIPPINKKRITSSWEQRKAKELFISTADKGYPDLPVLSATQDRGMIRRDENSINIFHDKKNEAGYKRVLPGQFVIHLRSFQGGFAHSAIEGITSPAYTVFGFSEPEKHDSEYWKYVFTSKAFIRRLETVTYGIRDGRSISYDEFLTLSFAYPSKAEQTAIARYLDKLSDLITLHQRKPFFMKWRTSDANRNQTNRLVL